MPGLHNLFQQSSASGGNNLQGLLRGFQTRLSRVTFPTALAVGGVVLAAAAALTLLGNRQAGLAPAVFTKANGRIEIERVDIASKYPGRVLRIDVREGNDVERGQTIAQMDVAELNAQLAAAKAAVRRGTSTIERAKAEVVLREAKGIKTEVENANVAVVDSDRSQLSRRIRDALLAPQFRSAPVIDRSQIDPPMDHGRQTFVLDIPPRFEADVLAGRTPVLQLNIDATAMAQASIGAGFI